MFAANYNVGLAALQYWICKLRREAAGGHEAFLRARVASDQDGCDRLCDRNSVQTSKWLEPCPRSRRKEPRPMSWWRGEALP